MSGVWIKMCLWCRHFHQDRVLEKPLGVKCDAFPNGVPVEILDNSFDHRRSHPEDQGIQFEQVLRSEDLPNYLLGISDEMREKVLQSLFKMVEYNERERRASDDLNSL